MPTVSTAFMPCYILPSELSFYGLVGSGCTGDAMVADTVAMVQFASTLIDEACGRMDGDGNGSLVYSTYASRILVQVSNRNLIEIPQKPITAITPTVINDLQNMAASGTFNGQPFNCWYPSDLQPNTITVVSTGQLSGIISASGRYGYTRQNISLAYPDLFAFINPLNLVTMFGGPAPWVSMDVSNTDYDFKTGECWIPAGLQLQRYSEVWLTYNSGFDPRNIPRGIKFATAALTKNLLAKGGGTTGLQSFTLSRAGANMMMLPEVIDPTIDAMLAPYKNVRTY